ncbi:hypothetical protein AOLI_G00059630 [Acnodon oligacanthus]
MTARGVRKEVSELHGGRKVTLSSLGLPIHPPRPHIMAQITLLVAPGNMPFQSTLCVGGGGPTPGATPRKSIHRSKGVAREKARADIHSSLEAWLSTHCNEALRLHDSSMLLEEPDINSDWARL